MLEIFQKSFHCSTAYILKFIRQKVFFIPQLPVTPDNFFQKKKGKKNGIGKKRVNFFWKNWILSNIVVQSWSKWLGKSLSKRKFFFIPHPNWKKHKKKKEFSFSKNPIFHDQKLKKIFGREKWGFLKKKIPFFGVFCSVWVDDKKKIFH